MLRRLACVLEFAFTGPSCWGSWGFSASFPRLALGGQGTWVGKAKGQGAATRGTSPTSIQLTDAAEEWEHSTGQVNLVSCRCPQGAGTHFRQISYTCLWGRVLCHCAHAVSSLVLGFRLVHFPPSLPSPPLSQKDNILFWRSSRESFKVIH